nr:hypothetical protein [Tanacetum cinerariifolium]
CMARDAIGMDLLCFVKGLPYCKCSKCGRILGAYDLEVASPRALVHTGDKSSEDARSCVCHATFVVLDDALRALVGVLTPLIVLSQVMSTLTYVDSKTITQADGALSSGVPTPIPYDPYVAVRHAHLVDTNIKSDPEEAPSEAEES